MNISLRMGRVSGFLYTQRLKYSTSKLPAEFIVPLNDTIVCWHREQEFPYEYSLPVPEKKAADELSSVLQIGEEVFKIVRKPMDNNTLAQELSKITFTAKHRWFPRSRDKRAKKTPPDRPYL